MRCKEESGHSSRDINCDNCNNALSLILSYSSIPILVIRSPAVWSKYGTARRNNLKLKKEIIFFPVISPAILYIWKVLIFSRSTLEQLAYSSLNKSIYIIRIRNGGKNPERFGLNLNGGNRSQCMDNSMIRNICIISRRKFPILRYPYFLRPIRSNGGCFCFTRCTTTNTCIKLYFKFTHLK